MAYNHGREDRKWRIWKEAEEKLLRECGVDEATIEQIRIADRADFNSNRRFYRWTNDVAEYLEDMADRERQTEVGTVAELLDEIESENLYQVLVEVDGRTLKIVLLKMQGYSTKEIAPLVHLTTGAIYARLRVEFDQDFRYCTGEVCHTPKELFDLLADDYRTYLEIELTKGKREVTEDDEREADALCKRHLERWKEELE